MLSNLAPINSHAEKFVNLAANDCNSYCYSKIHAATALAFSLINILWCPLKGLGTFVYKAVCIRFTEAFQELIQNIWNGIKSIVLSVILIVLLTTSIFICCGNVFSCLGESQSKKQKNIIEDLQNELIALKNENEKVIVQAQETKEKLEQSLKKSQLRLSAAREKCTKEEGNHSSTLQALETLKKTQIAELETLKSHKTMTISQLEHKLQASMNDNNSELIQKNSNLICQIAQLDAEKTHLLEKIEKMTLELEKQNNKSNQIIAELKMNLETANMDLEAADAEIIRLEKACSFSQLQAAVVDQNLSPSTPSIDTQNVIAIIGKITPPPGVGFSTIRRFYREYEAKIRQEEGNSKTSSSEFSTPPRPRTIDFTTPPRSENPSEPPFDCAASSHTNDQNSLSDLGTMPLLESIPRIP